MPAPYPGRKKDFPPLYEPLLEQQRQIRLFFLQVDDSTQEDEPIAGLLVPGALDQVNARYVALSYVWGAIDASQSIAINGKPCPISQNLLEFLTSHRRRCRKRPEMRRMPLWIDSICINQANISERNSQVALMKCIYRNAGMVISWLGTSFPLCDWSFEVLRKFKEQIDRTHDPKASKVTDIAWLDMFPQACKQDQHPSGPLKNVVWDSIRELCEHTYWRRIWVFQEVVLGDIVMLTCGDDVIHLKDVMQVIRWLTGLNASLKKPENMDLAIWNMISSGEFPVRVAGLRSILHICAAKEIKDTDGWILTNMLRDYEATDPRDKIYGSLAVTHLDITPDYSKNVKDVYLEAATVLMKERFELVLLLSGSLEPKDPLRQPFDIPSWVPDWTLSGSSFQPVDHPFTASKGRPQSLGPEIKGDSLYCSGVVCEEVVAVEPVLTPEDCLKFCCDYLASRETEKYPSGIPHLRALFQILLSNWDTMANCRAEPESMIYQVVACGLLHLFLDQEIKYRSRTGTPQINNPLCELGLGAKYSDLTTIFWNKIVGTSKEPSCCVITGPREQQPAAMNAIGEKLSTTVSVALLASLRDRRIFHTKNGYLGIGLESTRIGDQVCVAFGCDIPVLLRPQESCYVHVGPCYVVGFMEGEAMGDIRKGKRDTTRFEIR
ncbi:putative Heterokaryon incompatibility protein-domain-containing protein [Seiridium cardinale]